MPDFKQEDRFKTSNNLEGTIKVIIYIDGEKHYVVKFHDLTGLQVRRWTATESWTLLSKYNKGEVYYGSGHWFIVTSPDRMVRLNVAENTLWDAPEEYEEVYGPLKLYKHAMLNG